MLGMKAMSGRAFGAGGCPAGVVSPTSFGWKQEIVVVG